MRPKAPPAIGQDWITTPQLEKGDLAARVTLLVFWSAGCEASLIRLNELATLADHLPPTLSVVAVHTPRFAYEQDRRVVEDVAARMSLDMTIVHDPQKLTWARYSPGGWPAAVLIDHRGRAVGASLGLDDLEPLEEAARLALARADDSIRHAEARGRSENRNGREPRRKRLPLPLPAPVLPSVHRETQGLAWPSGVCQLDHNRVAVADTGNDRVLILDLDEDRGGAAVSLSLEQIERPSDVCALDSSTLAVSLPDSGRVISIPVDDPDGPITILADELERPRGLAVDVDGSLVVTDSGDNQLIRVSADGRVGTIAGTFLPSSTQDSRRGDGPAAKAELHQPVAVARSSSGLAFLDAATSNLRFLTDKGQVRTVTSNSFQDFGLVDGPAHRASLQRPSGLTIAPDGVVFIADTGNNRIRRVDGRRVKTLGLAGLCLPEDLMVLDDGLLVVADTGNHRLLVVDPENQQAQELELRGLPPVDVPETVDELRGTVGERLVIDVPYTGAGPWTVTVESDPVGLVDPLEVVRHEPQPVSIALVESGQGVLQAESAGPHPSEWTTVRRELLVDPDETA